MALKGPPSKPASDSAVMASSAPKASQSSQAIQGNFPTLAESMGKSGPPKKPAPQHPPKGRSSSLSLKAAYASISSTAAPGKDTTTASSPRAARAPISTVASDTASAASSKSGAKTLEERGQETMSKKQKEKEETDPGMSYTYMVLEAIRNQGGPPASSEGVDWEEQKKKQWDSNVSRISAEISHTVMGVAPLPGLLLGKLLNAQPYESPV